MEGPIAMDALFDVSFLRGPPLPKGPRINTARTVLTSRTLFDLPSEIRNFIYEYAIREDEEIYIWDPQPSISLVSKEARSESLPIYLHRNNFITYVYQGDYSQLSRWLEVMGKRNLNRFRRLVIACAWGDLDAYSKKPQNELRKEFEGWHKLVRLFAAFDLRTSQLQWPSVKLTSRKVSSDLVTRHLLYKYVLSPAFRTYYSQAATEILPNKPIDMRALTENLPLRDCRIDLVAWKAREMADTIVKLESYAHDQSSKTGHSYTASPAGNYIKLLILEGASGLVGKSNGSAKHRFQLASPPDWGDKMNAIFNLSKDRSINDDEFFEIEAKDLESFSQSAGGMSEQQHNNSRGDNIADIPLNFSPFAHIKSDSGYTKLFTQGFATKSVNGKSNKQKRAASRVEEDRVDLESVSQKRFKASEGGEECNGMEASVSAETNDGATGR